MSLFTVKGLDLVLAVALIPYLIQKVGIANYGSYAFALAFVLFFANVINYGFDLSAVRELSINKGNSSKVNKLFNEVFSVKLYLWCIITIVLVGLIFIIPQFKEMRMLYISASFILVGDLFSLRWFFLGLEKMKFITIISFFSTLIYILLLLIFVQQEKDFIWIPLTEAIGLFIVSGITFISIIKQYKITIQLLSFSEFVAYLQLNFNSYINLLLPSTTGVLIVFLVGLFGMPYNVALTEIGVKFSNIFATANTVLTTIFYPMVNRDKKNLKPTRYALLGMGFILSMVMYCGSSFFILNWLHLESIIDTNYTVQIVKILSPTPFLMGVVSSYGVNGLLVFFKDQLYSSITISATIFMIVVSFFLIPQLPIIGGAISLLLGRSFYALSSFYFYKTRTIKVC